jgi:hypothetical protein
MSNTPGDGGPAFAREGYYKNVDEFYPQHGMSLRDYFAAAALQGVLANPARIVSAEWVAEFSHQCADAMLAARKEKP